MVEKSRSLFIFNFSMAKFIRNIIVFISCCLLSFFAVFDLADGSTDAIYLKFATPKTTSLVLGGSRASQGIRPKYLNAILERDDLYNYSFQNPSSPYGDIYLTSIKRKLKNSNIKGVFILEVNPWNMVVTNKSNDTSTDLMEVNGFLDKTKNVNIKPNLEYFIESFNQRYITIIENRIRKGQMQTYFIEDDGWLKVTIESDSLSNHRRKQAKLNIYREKIKPVTVFSDYRVESLRKTIEFLKKSGEVYVVRLPVHKDMFALEEILLPNFDSIIQNTVNNLEVPYFNKTSSNYKYNYIDGHHLDQKSSVDFSNDLAQTILDFRKTKN